MKAVLLLCSLLGPPHVAAQSFTPSAAAKVERTELKLKGVLIVKGPVTALTDHNTLLVLSNAGSLPYPLSAHCLMFRFRVFDLQSGEDVTEYAANEACSGGEVHLSLAPGTAGRFGFLLPDITHLPDGRYRLEAYFQGDEQRGAPVATTMFTKSTSANRDPDTGLSLGTGP